MRAGLVRHDGRARPIAKQAGADEHARIVVQIKRRAANLDADTKNRFAASGLQQARGGPQIRQRCPASLPDQIQRQHRRVQAEPFAHIAGQPRAQVARAGADDHCADVGGFQPGLFQSAFGRLGGEQRGVMGEASVQRVGSHLESFRHRIQGEVAADNAVVAEQDFLDDRAGAGS